MQLSRAPQYILIIPSIVLYNLDQPIKTNHQQWYDLNFQQLSVMLIKRLVSIIN